MSYRTILLVEDNPDDVALTRRALAKNRIANHLVVAPDGVEALDYLHGTGAHAGRDPRVLPALVLLDLKLPKLDGLEVLRELRAHEATRLLPVVVLTSSNEEADVVRSYHLGCNAYVRKPVDFDEFAKAVSALGLFWLVVNQPPPLPSTGGQP